MDGPLDFEVEDPLLISLPITTTKRTKLIGLDDLLRDYHKEKCEVIEREAKRAKAQKNYVSDEEDDYKEDMLSRKIKQCHDQMKNMGGEEEVSGWGLQLFRNQKSPPPRDPLDLGDCLYFRSFMGNEINSLVELNAENGEIFVEGLLLNGWLSKLVSRCGRVEMSIAKWTFHLMLYSPREALRESACDFWCMIMSSENKMEKLLCKIEWLPNYSDLNNALYIYGFSFNFSSLSGSTINSTCKGPPKNISAWIKFVSACCKIRNTMAVFSVSEVEELAEVVLFLSLDRKLQGLFLSLYGCLQSVINYFTDVEWNASCANVARSLSERVPSDLNSLRIVECISGSGIRSDHLRSAISHQILLRSFDHKVVDEEEILNLLISINVKDRFYDLFKMYIFLGLTENWLLSNPMFEDKPIIYEMWRVFLRNCSCQISSTDLRPYASKVRTKASYLLHGTRKK